MLRGTALARTAHACVQWRHASRVSDRAVAAVRSSAVSARTDRRRHMHMQMHERRHEDEEDEFDAYTATSDTTSTNTNSTSTTPPPPPPSATPAAAESSSTTPTTAATPANTRDLKPSDLVKELDRFIIGQSDAKKAVAIALRNRWRRHRLPAELRSDVTPKNLLLIGPTGSGKTEIARRLARLTHSPFIKVEATKYTEVGFHGRDVDSIIQDLVRAAISSAKARRKAEARVQVQRAVSDKLLAALTSADASSESFREALEAGQLEAIEVEVEVPVRPIEEDDESGGARSPTAAKMGRMFGDLMRAQRGGGKTELRKLSIADARPLLEEAEMDALVAPEEVTREALEAVQNDGIVFIDEIDKVASSGTRHSADASAEGVQRDLLPLLEGTTVTTKQGDINTDHILFICSGAFHTAKPSDLLAELQGRLPIRVELVALTEDDLYRVLSQTDNSLVAQQTALMAVDQVKLVWKDEALREIAKGQAKASGGRQNSAARGVSVEMNRSVENIGARRLNTVIERIVDELSYSAADDAPGTEYVVDAPFVRARVGDLLKTTDLERFIL